VPTLEARLARAEPRLRLIHVADAPSFERHHLPGALLVEPRELVDGRPPATGRLPGNAALEALFSKLGYTADAQFVIYDEEGGGWAGRFGWTLDVIGHRTWHYLDGGIHAWAAAGRPLESGAPVYPASTSVHFSLNRAPIAELEDVLAAIDDPDQLVWDVRSREEYLGMRKAAARGGHVPGAAHLDWMALKDPARALRLVEGLAELLAAHGIDPARRVITHCQTHHRSGLSYLVGRLLKFREIRAYHGSWSEWGNRDDTPIEMES
jgi:thiosulfate/3-mercaptopyruvate sulfurtransferase